MQYSEYCVVFCSFSFRVVIILLCTCVLPSMVPQSSWNENKDISKTKIKGSMYCFEIFLVLTVCVRSVLANDLPFLLSISQATHQFPMKVAKITIHIPYKDRYPTISLPSQSIPIFNYLIFVEQFVIILKHCQF